MSRSWKSSFKKSVIVAFCLLVPPRCLMLMLANKSADATHFFNRFNQALGWLKKLINQTNRKRFSPKRTRKNSTNQTNQKRLIPIEHGLRVCVRSSSHKPLNSPNTLVFASGFRYVTMHATVNVWRYVFYYLGHLFSNRTPLCYQCIYIDGAILCIYHYYY